jgi:RNA polymerase sigma-70 factor (ECF subfamily)
MVDEKIMELVSKGDSKKLSLLFERYHLALYNFFLRRNPNPMLCEDLTQNVFERLLKYKHSFNPNSSFKAWMFQIARSVYIDDFSKNKLRATHLEGNITPCQEESIQDSIETSEQYEQLQRALSLLSPAEREIIRFTRFQKLKYHEIAIILNISESGVKMRVHRAMKNLKNIYLKLDK